MSNTYSDRELVEGMINNNEKIILFFFYDKCTPMFRHINHHVYDRQAEIDELISELYLYLRTDDWRRLRQFNFSIKLMSWISIVANRFFRQQQDGIMKFDSIDNLLFDQQAEYSEEQSHQRLDIENLIHRLTDPRDRHVLRELVLEEENPQKIADEMRITVDNLYKIRQRAKQKLSQMIKKERNRL